VVTNYAKEIAYLATTTIEWTEVTWNPVRGCKKISPGCKNCYAEAFAERFRGVKGHPYQQGFHPLLVPSKLFEPFDWGKSRTVFVNSMSDLFQDFVPDSYVKSVVDTMRSADWHIYQVLTKRAARLKRLLRGALKDGASAEHIWWGVSVEDRKHGLPRIQLLKDSGAAVKFLSIEPLLEDLGEIDLRGLDWVIVGGESGRGARPMERAWVKSIQEQCLEEGVHFFFKQWGGFNKGKAGRLLDGKTHDSMPPIVQRPIPAPIDRKKVAAALVKSSWQPEVWGPRELR
jgi:protein gp37